MTSARACDPDAGAPRSNAWRWQRLLVISLAAVILASCRSLTVPPVPLGAAALVARPTADAPADRPAVDASSAAPETDVRAAATATGGAPAAVRPAVASTNVMAASAIMAVGDGQASCRTGACGRSAVGPPCPAPPPCPTEVCVCGPRPVPRVAPCLVCDGGDAGPRAMPVARHGLKNLTSGDTVARYRAADDGPDACDVHVTASNCTCVFAPRFGSVRQVTRPYEDARQLGPRGLSLDTTVEAKIDLQPVCRTAQTVSPEAARKALPGVAVEERLGPLAVDQGNPALESDGLLAPAEDVLEDRLERAERVQAPRLVVGFDVPLAWTCARAAMVTVGTRRAEVVAADRGTATLRLESPGRAELTLCKRAGSDTARVGEELDFMIYYVNSGDRPLADVVLADALPGRLELVPGSAAANRPADFSTRAGEDGSVVLTWQFSETLKPGEGGFVRFRTLVR